MTTFLSDVVADILAKQTSISDYTLILPSIRAGRFLKTELKNQIDKPILLPEILSIEDFIYELSSVASVDNTTLLFEFYSVYLKHTKTNIDDFETFSKWATTALQDFNEIDRHLVDAEFVFNYLDEIKKIEEWNVQNSDNKLIKNYFSFFKHLNVYYKELYENLLAKSIGYQGLQYREAAKNIHDYIDNNTNKKLVFIGFNALNKAEETIITELLDNELATIYWDIDNFYFEEHPAGGFTQDFQKKWHYFEKHPFNWVKDNFKQQKNINVIGAPKNNTQLKYVGEILSEIKSTTNNYQDTALVLADESLLPLALNSLPESVENVNITMGYDLVNMSISSFFESLFNLHVQNTNKRNGFYYKHVLAILNHAVINKIVSAKSVSDSILKNNHIYVSKQLINDLLPEKETELFELIFGNWNNDAQLAIKNCIQLIEIFKDHFTEKLDREFLFKNLTVFKQIESLNSTFGYLKNCKTLQQIYQQIIRTEKLSFQGEPLSGLQLMGILETRVLDFENIIITSVNEGVIPKGKSNNSFIPFDVKLEVGLPTYTQRDAIFSYHFYRLLQRAKNIYLLYNTENDSFGSGEQSRFITELDIKKPEFVEKQIVSPKVITEKSELQEIEKTDKVYQKLIDLAEKGLSPTSITSYINNPIDFYKQKVLGIREADEAEETIAANTLGTIIHKTLEAFYLPLRGKFVKKEDILQMKKNVAAEVAKWFAEEYKNGDISSGKNLLVFNVAKQFVINFLNLELKTLSEGKQLKIIDLEYDIQSDIQVDGIDFSINLKGQVDRIDELDGVLRIIDYKTGSVQQSDLNIKDWSLVNTDYKKHSKLYQVMLYAYMYKKNNNINLETQSFESGVVSFKNLNNGFLKVNKKEIEKNDVEAFTKELSALLLEIFNKNTPFTENENKSF